PRGRSYDEGPQHGAPLMLYRPETGLIAESSGRWEWRLEVSASVGIDLEANSNLEDFRRSPGHVCNPPISSCPIRDTDLFDRLLLESNDSKLSLRTQQRKVVSQR